ncbi:MAG: lipopolysaccharide biosynthesis protein [Acidobacteria bacterium]|nr:lipopolysaccharide biosynthesis protein [Acidobacteriota bacterium]MBS1865017.1 lipopolysaccharide biosynthesis protein [Acidobacteriota bacterium]
MAAQAQFAETLDTDHLNADLKGRSVRGGLVTLLSQGAQFVMQSVATVVLARLLVPADFGVVAMVTAITGLATAFADFGLSEATIQQKEINHAQVSTLFWINVAIGTGLMAMTAAVGPILARFYREPRLLGITLVLSLTFFIGGLRVQPNALIRRQMRFSVLAFRDILSYLIAVPVAILMAVRGYGYWALVALPLTLNFVQMVVSWLVVRWRPGAPSRSAQIGSMIRFGGHVSASYLILNLNRSLDNVLVGWYWGATPLGLYSRAYNLLMLPVRQLSGPAGSVAIPSFSRLQDDPERFARYFLAVVSLLVWITVPTFGFLFVAAKPVIVIILGSRWVDAAPVFQILVISALGQLLLESIVWLLVSRGQSSRLLQVLLAISPIIALSYVLGLPYGIRRVALSGSLVLVALLPWVLSFSFRGTKLSLLRLGRTLIFPLSLCLVSILVSGAALRMFQPRWLPLQLVVVALSFLIIYGLSLFAPAIRTELSSFREILSAFTSSRVTSEQSQR